MDYKVTAYHYKRTSREDFVTIICPFCDVHTNIRKNYLKRGYDCVCGAVHFANGTTCMEVNSKMIQVLQAMGRM